jgi:hypothetical protein
VSSSLETLQRRRRRLNAEAAQFPYPKQDDAKEKILHANDKEMEQVSNEPEVKEHREVNTAGSVSCTNRGLPRFRKSGIMPEVDIEYDVYLRTTANPFARPVNKPALKDATNPPVRGEPYWDTILSTPP